MFHDILEKMCEVEYFKIFFLVSSPTLLLQTSNLSSYFLKFVPLIMPMIFFFFLEFLFLFSLYFFFLQPVYSLFFLKQSISIVFFCFYFRSFSPSYLIEAMSSRIVFKMSALIDVVFSYCFPFDNLFTFSLSYFYIGHHFTFFFLFAQH